jgi:hypothetical protein
MDIEADQDVFHIIASDNGGADHPENYDLVKGNGFNRAIGSKFDHINCFMAGKLKCEKAVTVSKTLGSHTPSASKHKRYSGKSAAELYKEGEAWFRDARAKMRQTRTEL